jgi:hypothetical protein
MKPKCKPGDLAVVIWAHNQENLGTIVKILQVHPDQKTVVKPEGDTVWTAQAPRPMTYEDGGVIKRRRKGPVPDSQLQPIRGANPKAKQTGTSKAKSRTVVRERDLA